MEEGVAAPVRRVDACAQVLPVADLVHRLVLDDLFQDHGRRRPVDPAQHQEAAVEPRREQVHEIGVDGGEIVAMVERVHELLAHGDQRFRPARRHVEPAKQLLAPRLGAAVKLGGGRIGRRLFPRLDRALDALAVGTETGRQRLEEGDARADGELGIAHEHFARERGAGRFAADREERVAQVDEVLRVLGGGAAPPGARAVDERAPAIGDRL